MEHLRAEEGNLVGYHSMTSTTPKVLLTGNRSVHSRNVTYDLTDFKKAYLTSELDPNPKQHAKEVGVSAEEIIRRSMVGDKQPPEQGGHGATKCQQCPKDQNTQ